MALPIAATGRKLQHRRLIDIEIFSRGTHLWEVDARISDVRTERVELASGLREAGEPIHEMVLRLVVDDQMNIVEAGAETVAMPFVGACDAYGDVYSRLVGLNLMQRFRHAVRERLGGVQGCTHVTELAQVLPTAVVQAFADKVFDTRGTADDSQKPFQIDHCHALRSDGPTVRNYYPRWYRAAELPTTSSTEPDRAQTS